jgi:pimeloyl-ACP methyl ester carboxylesterase
MTPTRLLFLPGAAADPGFWRPLGDRLQTPAEKVYFGWPGLGRQAPDPAVNSFEDLVALVEAQLGDGPVDLLAQSMGGGIAIQVALRHPGKVRRLVLSVTSVGIDVTGLGGLEWRGNYGRNFPQAAAWVQDARPDFTADLPGMTCPILLLWGDADPISPVTVGETLAALLPDARLHVTPGGDHDIVATHAQALAPLVAQHLGLKATA